MSGVSNHYDAMVAIKGIIDALNLGVTTVIQEVAEWQNGQETLPFVSISPHGPERVANELNDRDGTYYGILVAIIAKEDVNSLETRLGWRQSMRRNLNNRSLGALNQNYNCTVEPGNVVEPAAWYARKLFVSGFVVRASFQEPRT